MKASVHHHQHQSLAEAAAAAAAESQHEQLQEDESMEDDCGAGAGTNSVATSTLQAHYQHYRHCTIERGELQRLVDEHLYGDDPQTAAFWAEKVLAVDGAMAAGSAEKHASLNERLPQIAEYLAVLTAARSWQTIIKLIDRHDLFTKHLVFAYFHVNSLFNRDLFSDIIALPIGYLGRWDDVPFIAPDSATYIRAESDAVREPSIRTKLDEICRQRKYEARLLFLLTKTYLMVQNRPAAAGCLRHCLNSNPYCNEALHLAIDSRLLKTSELRETIASSPLAAMNPSGMRIMHQLLDVYDLNQEPSSSNSSSDGATANNNNKQLMKSGCGSSATSITANSQQDAAAVDSPAQAEIIVSLLSTDLSFQSAYAFRFYSQGDIQQAYNITSAIMHEFGYYSKCFLVHIACLVQLNKTSELFQLGHSMVDLKRELEITWYTVGAYYYATGQYTTAKKFLNKCTTMNSGFGEGWLAYGHTLFYVEEHEQAMNCYLRASRILEGHFEPLLYTAVEYCFANNFKLATDFLHDAEIVAGADPIVLHEQGTVAYMEQEFKKAEQVLMEALRLVTKCNRSASLECMLAANISDFWEPLCNNLGHTLRKLEKYEQAILVHRKSLLLGTTKADAWACIGICHASLIPSCVGDSTKMHRHINAAMEALNHALTVRPGDDLTRMALEKVMQFSAEQMPILFPTHLDGATNENLDTLIEQRTAAAAANVKKGTAAREREQKQPQQQQQPQLQPLLPQKQPQQS